MRRLAEVLRQTSLVRYLGHLEEQFPTGHLKDLLIDEVGPDRMIRVGDRWVVNFGSDSFLGLDQDPRVHDALVRGIRRWGTHSGTRGPSPASAPMPRPRIGSPAGWAPRPP